ncbi:hypothetical protein [Thermococcus peptonophilus]|uniref:hypothetical protein n=1 Tax=Thermococcus peptonophilus TaxID=53952 RepID=UPI000AD1B7A9
MGGVSGNVYHVKAIFYPDAQLRGVRAFLILRDLEEIGGRPRDKAREINYRRRLRDVDELEFKVVTKASPEEIKKLVSRHPEIKDVIVTLLAEGAPEPAKTEEETETVEGQPSENEGITLRIFLEKDAPLKGIRSFLVLQEIEKRTKVLSTNPARSDIQNGDIIDGHYFEVTIAPGADIEEIKEAVLKHPDVADVEVVEPGTRPP